MLPGGGGEKDKVSARRNAHGLPYQIPSPISGCDKSSSLRQWFPAFAVFPVWDMYIHFIRMPPSVFLSFATFVLFLLSSYSPSPVLDTRCNFNGPVSQQTPRNGVSFRRAAQDVGYHPQLLASAGSTPLYGPCLVNLVCQPKYTFLRDMLSSDIVYYYVCITVSS